MEDLPRSYVTAGDTRIPTMCLTTWKGSDEALEVGLKASLDTGYRRIRTTFEETKTIGPIIKGMIENNEIRREDLFISAKLPPSGNRRKDVEYFIRKSLDELQLEYLDLYELGSPMGFVRDGDSVVPLDENGEIVLDLKTDIIEIWKGMEEQVVAGRTKSIGLTYCNQNQIQRILNHCTIKPANLTNEIHIYCQQKELVSFCQKNGIAVTALAPLGCPGLQNVIGAFEGKRKVIPSVLKDPVIKEIAKNHNKKTSQIALRYLIEYGVTLAIRSVDPKRLKECYDIFDFELNREEFEQISDLDREEDGRLMGGSSCTGILNQLEKHPEFPF